MECNMFGGVVYNTKGHACDIGVEDWFAQAVVDYMQTHTVYSFHTAFIFLHACCFAQKRPLHFYRMRGNTTLLLAQAIGDYSVLKQWCIDGTLPTGVRYSGETGQHVQ
jgi:hypothetical protein